MKGLNRKQGSCRKAIQTTNCSLTNHRIRCCGRVLSMDEVSLITNNSQDESIQITQEKGQGRRMRNNRGQGQGQRMGNALGLRQRQGKARKRLNTQRQGQGQGQE